MAEAEFAPDPLAAGEVRAAAPAKVNLYLHVIGRRADGYHLLDSLVVFAGAADIVTAAPDGDLSLDIDGPFAKGLPADSGNLVFRAAVALADKAGIAPKARIRLTKTLPVASGVGGGSADAAAALRCLSHLWGLHVSAREMADLALSLGADVPVCLAGIPSFVGGIGEDIVAAPHLPEIWMVLANPGVAVSTPAVFKARTGAYSLPGRFETISADPAGFAGQLTERNNDLMVPAASLAPAIGAVLTELGNDPDCLMTRMTGSGATCFALFDEKSTARREAARIRAAYPDWWATSAPVLGGPAGIEVG